jgi:DNA modification methylase
MRNQIQKLGRDAFTAEFESLFRMVPTQEADSVTHHLHPYPAKFLPHFPRLFIKYFSREGDLVVDPMCGSGTTLIEAALQNRNCFGVDIDPIAALISKVSVTPVAESDFQDFEKSIMSEIKKRLHKGDSDKVEMPGKEDFPNLSLWFREDVFRELSVIRDTILESDLAEGVRDFGLLCLSMIIKPVSNADPRDIFPERDLKEPIRARKETFAEFQKAFHRNKMRVLEYSRAVCGSTKQSTVRHGDARKLELPDRRASLVFTSPPYAYAMDYARVHQLSTLLFIMSNKDLVEHRRKYIGTERISVNTSLSSFEGFQFAHQEIETVYTKDRKLGVILHQYFSDMHKVTQEAYRILKPGGSLIYVIGNSTIKGTAFRTDEVFIRICQEVGFEIKETLERPYYAYRMARKRNVQSNIIKSDIFLVAQK